jgi:hypothetical protein
MIASNKGGDIKPKQENIKLWQHGRGTRCRSRCWGSIVLWRSIDDRESVFDALGLPACPTVTSSGVHDFFKYSRRPFVLNVESLFSAISYVGRGLRLRVEQLVVNEDEQNSNTSSGFHASSFAFGNLLT